MDVSEEQYDEHLFFVDRLTGQVDLVQREVLRLAEEGEDIDELPKWRQPQFEIANGSSRIRTASRVFPPSTTSTTARSCASLRRHYREKGWYSYRTEALREIAIEWCEEHGTDYTDRRPDPID